MDGQVGSLGEVLAQQPIGVLVGAALPGAVRVAEVHLHVQRRRHACMQGEFGSLVPCQAVAQQCGQGPHLADDGVLHVFGVVPVGQAQEDREPGGAFHEEADRAAVAGTADQAAFPVAGDRPVGDLGRPVADHDHGLAEPGASGLAVAAVPAYDAPPSHGMFELESQLSLALHVDGLADGLAARVHAIVAGMFEPEPAADPFGAPVPVGPALTSSHRRVPGAILRSLGRLRRWEAICRARFGPYPPPMSSALRRSSRLICWAPCRGPWRWRGRCFRRGACRRW